jgi:hypothetical protein|tara:strand:- start:49 stop:249 length:201 start_codon:yes stop_codon:yes gene_type:complete
MKTTIIDGKEVPVIEPAEVKTKITNIKTGQVYASDNEWKSQNIPESEIRKDVHVVMPRLDLFGKTK